MTIATHHAPEPEGAALVLPLVAALASALERENVSYCHWKSTTSLARSLTGANDLDLLVRREDGDRFAAVLHELAFKGAVDPPIPLPGVLDFYGHDPAAKRLLHVHAHYQLVVGDDFTKNYRIPLEAAFLEHVDRGRELPVPVAELELILLVLRLTLKHNTWDAFALRRALIGSGEAEELLDLETRSDQERVAEYLDRYLPPVSAETFARCQATVHPGARAQDRLRAGAALTAELRPYARRPRAADVAAKAGRRGERLVLGRLLRRAPHRRRLAAGGAVVAALGADGAGKSTAVDALEHWLGRTFNLDRVHLGRPPRSATTRVVWLLLLGAAAARRAARRQALQEDSILRSAMLVALARDRYRTARDAHRAAADGGVVLSDRWPVPELKQMDAPRIRGRNPRHARLADLEESYYARIARPHVTLVLRVPPDVAVARRDDEPEAFVRARWAEIWDVDWDKVGAKVVDATPPADEVASTLKSLVWASL
jgi:thymidylate kinase